MKKVLIFGKGSYVGSNVEAHLNSLGGYDVTILDAIGDGWRSFDFDGFDSLFHVAGIAHADVSSVSDEVKRRYYAVNTDLALEVAEKAKKAGVHQFIFMSSMIIYGGCKDGHIRASTEPCPSNFYGDSKWQADKRLQEMQDDSFNVSILRPPMIYGPGCKGNYQELRKLALKLPVFPKSNNRRSMLYIGNLCEFVRRIIDENEKGIFFPQNAEYSNTSELVKWIAEAHSRKILIIPFTNWLLKLMMNIPGRIGNLATKAFGDSFYEADMSRFGLGYDKISLRKSIKLIEAGVASDYKATGK